MQTHQKDPVRAIVGMHTARTSDDVVTYLGHKFVIFRDVFSPFIAPSGIVTRAAIGITDFSGKRVLEVGCGAGIFACMAALGGAAAVVATDINPRAVQNAQANAEATGVANRVSTRAGDMFSTLQRNEVFDLIYADLPLARKRPATPLERAFYSENLEELTTVAEEAHLHLSPRDGQVLLCLSNFEEQRALSDHLQNRYRPRIEIETRYPPWVTLHLYRLMLK